MTACRRCARQSTSAAITPPRRVFFSPRTRSCLARPARAIVSAVAGAASSSASRPGTFRWRSSSARSTAALAAGNAVVAKPAEQTPLVALRAFELLQEAGIPRAAAQLAPGDGRVGAALVAHPAIAGVAFTGSTETAWAINRTLAGKTRSDRAADRRDRRHQRHDRRRHRAAGAGAPTMSSPRPSARPASAARRCGCCASRTTSPTASSR